MKKSMTLTAAVLLLALTVALSVLHFATSRGDGDAERMSERQLAERILGELRATLLEPLTVARTVARDQFVVEFLKNEGEDAEADGAKMAAFLEGLRREFGYSQMTLVSRATRRYYRDDGIYKIIDPQNDPGDAWFEPFERSGEFVGSNVYVGPQGESMARLYLNLRVEDEDGNFLGVASPSLFVGDLRARLRRIERRYNVKVDMTDPEGLVLLSSNFSDIYTASLKYLLPKEPDAEFRCVREGWSRFAVTKFVSELGWYFVVRGESEDDGPGGWIFYAAAAAMLAATFAILVQTRSIIHAAAWHKASPGAGSQVDRLTGLPNRNFFKDMFGERGVFNTTRYRCLAVFDIDFFKEANDNMNGDEALLSVVHDMMHLLQDRGMVLRWGGDEFLVLFEPPMESAFAICRQFVKDVEAGGLVTVSVGLTSVRISDTIKKNYYRAAQYCYAVKEMGGNGVKRD